MHGAQRVDFCCCNAKLVAKVAPQGYWNYPKGTEQTPTHAQETNMERQTKLVGITSACIDCVALGTIEGEKCLHLEVADIAGEPTHRSEEHTSELQSLMRISYAVFCLKKKNRSDNHSTDNKESSKKGKQSNNN